MFLINSRSAAFVAAQILPWAGHLANLRPAVLPSSLRIVLSIAFVYSTRPPVSVYSTVSHAPFTSLFLKTDSYFLKACLELFAFAIRINLTYKYFQT